MDCSRRFKHHCRDRDMPYAPTSSCMSQRRIDGHHSGAKAMTTNQPIDGVPRAYADLERINIHGEADRKGEDGNWIKTWKERQPGKTISHHSRASGLWNKISARCLAVDIY